MPINIPSGAPHEWHDEALCAQVDPALFFPAKGSGADAKRICADCPVQVRCLESALDEEEGRAPERRTGIRGGLGAKARYDLSRSRKGAAA